MTDKNLTSIHMIIDASGSMRTTAGSVIAGFNKFIEEQKSVPGDCLVSVTFFNGKITRHLSMINLNDIKDLDSRVYSPEGGTALYDALVSAIDDDGKAFAAMKEEKRPGKVLFVVFTDGYENCSEHKKEDVTSRIKIQETNYAWNFVFIGANLDAQKEAATLGFSAGGMNYDATARGTETMYKSMSRGVSSYRTTGRASDVVNTPKSKP